MLFNGNLSFGVGRYGSSALAAILYQTSLGNFVYKTLESDSLGSELVVNGTFDTDADWNKNSNWTIVDGVAVADGTSSLDINQGTTIPSVGASYIVEWEIISLTQGTINIQFGDVNTTLGSTIGKHSQIIKAISIDRLRVYPQSSAIGSIDNVSVREVLATEGSIVLDNQGSLGSFKDGLPYSGRGIQLGALNDVDIPIHHTLGAELANITGFTRFDGSGSVSTITYDTIRGFTLNVTTGATSSNYRPYIKVDGFGGIVSGNAYLIGIDTTSLTGVLGIKGVFDGTTIVDVNKSIVVGGTTYIEVIATSDYPDLLIYTDSYLQTSNWVVSDVSVKQITNPSSYLTYYDFTDGLVTLGNSVDGGSSDNLELVDTANDATTWGVYGTNLIEQDLDAVKVTYVDNALGGFVYLKITGGLSSEMIIGKKYYISFKSKVNTGLVTTRLAEGVNYDNEVSNTTYQTYNIPFTHSALNPYFTFSGMSAGETIWVKDISVKEILPISTKYTLNTKTVNNVITHTTPWSTSDWTKINNNPNYVGKLALETTGATKTIPELDMVMDRGSELVTNGTFDTNIESWTNGGSDSSSIIWNAGKADIKGNSYLSQQISGLTAGRTYIIEASVTETNSLGSLRIGYSENIGDLYDSSTFNSSIDYSIEITPSGSSFWITLKNEATPLNISEYSLWDNVSVREVVQDSYYMCSEKSGAYLVDSRVAYGADLLDAVAPTVVNLDEITTFTSDTSNNFNLAVTAVGTSQLYPYVNTNSISALSTNPYYVEFTVSVTSGTPILSYIRCGGNSTLINETLISKTYGFIVKSSGLDTSVRLNFDGRSLFGISITGYTVREATAIEIANYPTNDTVRTNADLQQKGIQTTAFVTDGAGVPTAYSGNELVFDGNSYIDTQKIIDTSKPLVVEVGMVVPASNSGWMIGAYTDVNNFFRINANTVQVDGLVSATWVIKPVGTNIFIQYIFDGATVIIKENDVIRNTTVMVGNGGINISLLIGAQNYITIDNLYSSNLKHFKLITDVNQVENYDATKAYNDYIA